MFADQMVRNAPLPRTFLAAAVGNLIAGLVGGQVDPEKLDQIPQLLILTTASLIISGIALGLLAIPIRRLMRGVHDVKPTLDSQTDGERADLITSSAIEDVATANQQQEVDSK